MVRGALVYVEKDKNGDRFIDAAIQRGVLLYSRHHMEMRIPAQELMALVNPRLYLEQKLQERKKKSDGIDVDWHDDVPYGYLWIVKIGDIDNGHMDDD